MIYVPELDNNKCYVVIDKDTIREYSNTPTLNEYVNYRDYFINSHYIYKDSTEYIEHSITCADINNLTSDFYYRNDISDILVIFIIIVIVCIYFPLILFSKIFKKRGVI